MSLHALLLRARCRICFEFKRRRHGKVDLKEDQLGAVTRVQNPSQRMEVERAGAKCQSIKVLGDAVQLQQSVKAFDCRSAKLRKDATTLVLG